MLYRLLIISYVATLNSTLGQSSPSELYFEAFNSNVATTYNLKWHNGETTKTVWTRQVSLIRGNRPANGCELWNWKHTDEGILALVNFDNFTGVILRLSPSGEMLAESPIGERFLRPDLYGKVKLAPPDKVELHSQRKSGTEEYFIKDGHLLDRDGTPPPNPRFLMDVPENLQLKPPAAQHQDSKKSYVSKLSGVSNSPEVLPPKQTKDGIMSKDQISSPRKINEKSTESTTWSVALASIIVAIAILSWLVRNRNMS